MTGISHFGASSYGWYHASTKPLRSTTGYVRTRALRFVHWLYGMFEHAPSPLNFQPWKGHVNKSPSTEPPYARCAPRCGQNASCRWNVPDMSRHRTSSRFQYSTAVTSPGARSPGNATWYQPNGIGNGKRREAMARL